MAYPTDMNSELCDLYVRYIYHVGGELVIGSIEYQPYGNENYVKNVGSGVKDAGERKSDVRGVE